MEKKAFPKPVNVVYLSSSVFDAALCDKVSQCSRSVVFLGTSVSSTNKTDHHDITEILLQLMLNTITLLFSVKYVGLVDKKKVTKIKNFNEEIMIKLGLRILLVTQCVSDLIRYIRGQ